MRLGNCRDPATTVGSWQNTGVILRRAFLIGATSLLLQGSSMDRFGMHGKIVAKAGQRDALVEHLLEAARLLNPLPGCEIYIVSVAPSEPDAIWVTEVWRTEADHDASLKLDSVRALIARAKPLIAGGSESMRLIPLGGKGLSPA
jgi:quinol monooxygenase YgiN